MRAVVMALLVAAACERAHAPEAPTRASFHVIATYDMPGATAAELETGVLTPAERALAHVPGMTRMRGEARAARVRIAMAFGGAVDPTAIAAAAHKQLAGVLFPAGVEPGLLQIFADDDAVVRYTLRSRTVPLATVADAQAQVVRPALVRVAGVAEVTTCGSGTRRIEIHASAKACTAAGLAVTDVDRAVLAAAAPVTIDTLRSLVLATRNGAPVRLADVANVIDGVTPTPCFAADEQGTWVVAGAAYLAPRVDGAAARRAVEQVLSAARAALPAGVELAELPVDPPAVLHVADERTGVESEASMVSTIAHALPVPPGKLALVMRGTTGAPDEPDAGVTDVRVWPAAAAEAAARALAPLQYTTRFMPDPDVLWLSGGDPAALHAARGVVDTALGTGAIDLAAGAIGDVHEPATTYQVDDEAAHRLGIAEGDLSETLRAIDGERSVGTAAGGNGAIPIVLSFGDAGPTDVQLRAASGALVALAVIAREQVVDRVRQIVHVDGRRVVGVRANLRGEAGSAAEHLQRLVDQVTAKLAPAIHVERGGA